MHNASWLVKCQMHDGSIYRDFMTDKSERLRIARERAGYPTAKEAAEAMGVSVSTYIQNENGSRGYPAGKAERYGKFFRVKPEWLLYGTNSNVEIQPLGPTLYVKGEVAAGVFKEAWEIPEDEWQTFIGRADVAAPLKDRYFLKVSGDSMNMLYPDQSLVEVVAYHGDYPIPPGKRVIVQRKNLSGGIETTVKEYMVDDAGHEWLVPRSTNPTHQSFRADVAQDGIESIEIIAVVVASVRPE